MQVSRLAVAFLLMILASHPLYANGVRCESLFENTEALSTQQVFRTHYSIQAKQSKASEILISLALRKIQSIKSEHEASLAVVEAEQILKIAHLINKDSVHLLSAPESAWFQREVLRKGLAEHINSSSPSRIRAFFKHRTIQFLLNPARLPTMKDRSIPADIFEKILRGGLETHQAELMHFYKSSGQNAVDKYRQFSKAYSVAFMAFLVYSLATYQENLDKQVNDARVDATFNNLDGMTDLLNILDQEFESRGFYKQSTSTH